MRPIMRFPHTPVLVKEVLSLLITDKEGIYIDGTAGTGGHSEAIAALLGKRGRLLCLDRDPEAVVIAKERLSSYRVDVIKANYALAEIVLEQLKIKEVTGILLDLGMSSLQLDLSGRGFSFLKEEALDMRMDPGDGETAADVVNSLSQGELARIFRVYGEEKKAGLIAKAIVGARQKTHIKTSLELADIISSVLPPHPRRKTIHPATRAFQALRIAVNRELALLEEFLTKAPALIKSGGRLAVISYHSLEDRMIKKTMALWERPCSCPPDLPACVCGLTPVFLRVNRRAIRPSQAEISENIRSRSAILRVAERV